MDSPGNNQHRVRAQMATTQDARAAGSRTRLHEAVLELAGKSRIEDVSMADIARQAGVTRATAYNHAAGPAELLRTVLGAEIRAFISDLVTQARLGELSKREIFEHTTRAFLEHLDARNSIYQRGLSGKDVSPTLLALLTEELTVGLRTFLEEGASPTSPPARLAARFGDPVHLMYAAHAAHGGVGLLRVWLNSESADPEELLEVTMSVLPDFWFDDQRA